MIGEIVRKLVIVAKDNFVDEMPSFGKKEIKRSILITPKVIRILLL